MSNMVIFSNSVSQVQGCSSRRLVTTQLRQMKIKHWLTWLQTRTWYQSYTAILIYVAQVAMGWLGVGPFSLRSSGQLCCKWLVFSSCEHQANLGMFSHGDGRSTSGERKYARPLKTEARIWHNVTPISFPWLNPVSCSNTRSTGGDIFSSPLMKRATNSYGKVLNAGRDKRLGQ